MAANLAGVLAGLNKAITDNPFVGETGQGMLDMASQGFGGAMANLPGQSDPYSFMTQGAKEMQGADDLANVDVSTTEGMMKASKAYAGMGKTEEAVKMQMAGKALRDEQSDKLEEGSEEITRELDKKRLMRDAAQKGDMELVKALSTGAITAQDYYKSKFTNRTAVALHTATQDPYKGSFREKVMVNGKEVPMLFAAGGQPIRVLGEGKSDYQLAEVYDPSVGAMRQALVNKQNGADMQFVGGAEPKIPTYDVKETEKDFVVWQTPPDGSAPAIVGRYSQMSDAEKAQKKATSDMRSMNQIANIDEAINMIDISEDRPWHEAGGVGGFSSAMYSWVPGTDARTFEGLITSIKANVGFEELRTLKAEGGTLGQVSNIENILLQSAIEKLDSWQTPADLKNALETIRGVKDRMRVFTQDDPTVKMEKYFRAEPDGKGGVTGNRIYKINENSVAVIGPDGEYLRTVVGPR